MRYVVLDLEWNQYPPWVKPPTSPRGVLMKNEIIQIGAVITDQRFEVLDSFRVQIKLPQQRQLSKHVAQVVGCTQKDLDGGLGFEEAYRSFLTWCGDAQRVFTWGPDDERALVNNTRFYGLPMPELSWMDAQYLYGRQLGASQRQLSLASAIEHFQLPPDRQLHDALNDAYMTAQVLGRLDELPSLEAYRQIRGRERLKARLAKPRQSGRTKSFASRSRARAQALRHPVRCPQCGRALPRGGEQLGSVDQWLEVLQCEEHGEFLLQCRLNRREQIHYCSYALFAMDEPLRAYLEAQRARAGKKRPARGEAAGSLASP